MRWPARNPHVLTAGMKQALSAMKEFSSLINWRHFSPRNTGDDEIGVKARGVQVFACRDEKQAVVWLLRGNEKRNVPGVLLPRDPLRNVVLTLRGWQAGEYSVEQWDTLHGCSRGCLCPTVTDDGMLKVILPSLHQDLALAIRRLT